MRAHLPGRRRRRRSARGDQPGDLAAKTCSRPPSYSSRSSAKAAGDVVGVALDRHRVALAFGGPRAELCQLAGPRRALAAADRREQRAVADEVGIAADRRGEVAVGARVQAGVAEVPGRVVGLLERAQHERAERDPPTPGATHVLGRRAWRSRPRARRPGSTRDMLLGQRRRGHLERGQLVDQALDALGLGALVHAVQAGGAALLGEQARDGLVGGDHQVLDQPVGLGLRARARSRSTSPCSSKENSGSSESRTSAPLRSRSRSQRGGGRRARRRAGSPTARRPARRRRRCDRRARSPGARRSGSASGRRPR